MKKYNLSFIFIGLVFFISSCKKEVPPATTSSVLFDEPLLASNPPNFEKSSNDNLAQLGRVLFYDRKLSLDNTISCGSCHLQEKAFADDGKFSTGINGQKSTRNAPTVFPKEGQMFWDGRGSNLDEMVLMPITNPMEMNFTDLTKLCEKLSNTNYYPKLFGKAFGDERITTDKVRSALKEFVKNFSFTKNKFAAANSSGSIFSAEEKTGKNLFFGKAKCSECHHIEATKSNGYGVTNEAHNIGLDYEYADKGVGDITKDRSKDGQYFNPVLLNIEMTAPYMHDGRFQTLEEVIEHYDSKVVDNPNLDWRLLDYSDFGSLRDALNSLDRNRNGQIDRDESKQRGAQNLHLTDYEKSSLVAFLRTLSDLSCITDSKFSDPFK